MYVVRYAEGQSLSVPPGTTPGESLYVPYQNQSNLRLLMTYSGNPNIYISLEYYDRSTTKLLLSKFPTGNLRPNILPQLPSVISQAELKPYYTNTGTASPLRVNYYFLYDIKSDSSNNLIASDSVHIPPSTALNNYRVQVPLGVQYLRIRWSDFNNINYTLYSAKENRNLLYKINYTLDDTDIYIPVTPLDDLYISTSAALISSSTYISLLYS